MYKNMDITKQMEYLEELEKQEQQATECHNDMELIGLYDSVVRLKKSILINCVSSYGSGTIANIIGNTKYTQIDKAVNKTLLYLYHAEDEELHNLQVDGEGIAKLILKCYKARETMKDGIMIPYLV